MNGLDMPDYYQLLGVNYDAQSDEINRSYQAVCEKFSIFLYASREEILNKNKDLVIYKDAYDTLSDSQKRVEYDKNLEKTINEKSVLLENTHTRLISETSDLESSFFQEDTIKLEVLRVKEDILTENFTKGKNFLNNGQYHEAINVFRKLINMKPKEAKFHSYLALALEKKGWTAYAEEEFKIAIDLDPQDEVSQKYFEMKTTHSNAKKTSILSYNPDLYNNDNKINLFQKLKQFFVKQFQQ